ncbi:MAG: NADPH:quinone reductase [Candidatus Acidiferrales bacterium]
MRAAWYTETGPASAVIRVGHLERPRPNRGEVLVRVRASGVNPSDTKKRMGWRGKELEYPLIVPHHDGAGFIEDVGDNISRSRIGERVWIYNAQYGRAFGTAAEYVCLPSEQAVFLPEEVPFAEGACLGVPASTAHFAVFADGALRGKTLLIAGGAGAVGHYAIQFAKWGGSTVIATVSSQEKGEHARRAGADHILNYRQEDVVARVRAITAGDGVDRIVEVNFGVNLAVNAALIKPNGVIASYSSTRVPEPVLPYYPLAYKGVTLRLVQAYILTPEARQSAIRDITACLRRKSLINAIGHQFSIEEAAAAHEAVESGTLLGTAVIAIP